MPYWNSPPCTFTFADPVSCVWYFQYLLKMLRSVPEISWYLPSSNRLLLPLWVQPIASRRVWWNAAHSGLFCICAETMKSWQAVEYPVPLLFAAHQYQCSQHRRSVYLHWQLLLYHSFQRSRFQLWYFIKLHIEGSSSAQTQYRISLRCGIETGTISLAIAAAPGFLWTLVTGNSKCILVFAAYTAFAGTEFGSITLALPFMKHLSDHLSPNHQQMWHCRTCCFSACCLHKRYNSCFPPPATTISASPRTMLCAACEIAFNAAGAYFVTVVQFTSLGKPSQI